ncbi:TonB-dependent receptor plug domain-containing protein, partial [Bacteroidota bacterium]
DYAAFFSLKWDPIKALSIQPGIRFIYNTKYKAPLVYAISGKWNIADPLSLRVSYSRGFRAPSIKELYLFFKDVNHNIQGNPDLKAETSNNVNMNLKYAVENRKTAYEFEVSGFYNALKNIITLAQVPGSGTDLSYTYVNLDRYKTTGGQVNATFSLYPSLKVSAGLSETGINVEMADGTNTGGFKFSTDVNANTSYRFVKADLTLALLYKYTGKKTPTFL